MNKGKEDENIIGKNKMKQLGNFYEILNITKPTSRLESQKGIDRPLDRCYNTGVGVK